MNIIPENTNPETGFIEEIDLLGELKTALISKEKTKKDIEDQKDE